MEKKRKEIEERDKAQSPVNKVKRAMFKAVSVMTLGSMYSQDQNPEQAQPSSPKFAKSEENSMDLLKSNIKSTQKLIDKDIESDPTTMKHTPSFQDLEPVQTRSGPELALSKQ